MAGAGVRVAAFVQGFGYGRGRATTAVELLTPLVAAGHDVEVFVTAGAPTSADMGGVKLARFRDFDPARRYDVVVYNSGLGPAARSVVQAIHAPKLMCQHSYDVSDLGLRFADRVWFPSRAVMRVHHGAYGRFVIPPPVNPSMYLTKPGTMIGAASTSPWKGGALVAYLARKMPAHQFIVVRDPRGHGAAAFKGIANVTLRSFMEPRVFYASTRVLLFPSKSESYGRIAVEAAISGIPVVASTCAGIREAMDGHGIFLERHGSPGKWISIVDRLMRDPAYWRKASVDVLRRRAASSYRENQAAFVREIESMA